MRSAIPIKPYPTATTILLNLVSVATPLQLTSIASRPAIHRLAGDLVRVVPGVAGGTQHGGALLQLHLRQAGNDLFAHDYKGDLWDR